MRKDLLNYIEERGRSELKRLFADVYKSNQDKFGRLFDDVRRALPPDNSDNMLALLHRILDTGEGRGFMTYPERLEAISQAKTFSGEEEFVNTYPSATPPPFIFRDFLGICAGGEQLDSVLAAARQQSEQMCSKYSVTSPKNVVILTTKWDELLFKEKYERPFIRYALDHGVMYIFWLVTAQGIVRMPFLTGTWWQLERLPDGGYHIEAADYKDIKDLLAAYPRAEYHYINSIRWDKWAGMDYVFDFAKMVCQSQTCGTGFENAPSIETTIPKDAMDAFICRVLPLCNAEEPKGSSRACFMSNVRFWVLVLGRQYGWAPSYADAELYKELREAFKELIGKCVRPAQKA